VKDAMPSNMYVTNVADRGDAQIETDDKRRHDTTIETHCWLR
jgi:hypothetical protein